MKTITLKEAAQILHMHPCSVQQLVKSGRLPGRKVGKQWLFIDEDLLDWIRQGYGKLNPIPVFIPQSPNTGPHPTIAKSAESVVQARIKALRQRKP